MPDSSVWGAATQTGLCPHCDRRFRIAPHPEPRRCPQCFRADLDTPEEDGGPDAPPELLLPHTVSDSVLNRAVQEFAGGIWFAPTDLKAANLQRRLQRLYLPMWLVDSRASALWQAETGFNYQAVSHRDRFEQGRGGWTEQQITETRVRWEPRLGRLERTYQNVAAPALEEHFQVMNALGKFKVEDARPVRPGDLPADTPVRLPNRSTADAWPDAVAGLQSVAADECRRAGRADHLREFRWQPQFSQKNWTLLLLPVAATYYLDDEQQPQPILIHGQSGQLSGPRRASMRRARRVAFIIAGIAAAIFTVSLLVALASLLLPALLVVAAPGVALAVIIGMLAIVPPVMVWQANKNQ